MQWRWFIHYGNRPLSVTFDNLLLASARLTLATPIVAKGIPACGAYSESATAPMPTISRTIAVKGLWPFEVLIFIRVRIEFSQSV
jgi:hypothetical protein